MSHLDSVSSSMLGDTETSPRHGAIDPLSRSRGEETPMAAEPVVILVEDEMLIMMMLEDALTDAGFEVVTAATGTEALEQLGDDASGFRAVLTDIRLGQGPNGWDVAHRARELVHNMPIIYISGDSAHEWASNGVPNSIMIGKPFAPAQIVNAVATLLNKVPNY